MANRHASLAMTELKSDRHTLLQGTIATDARDDEIDHAGLLTAHGI
ncbi:MAG: hypothetical protein ABFD17_00065 [Anaerolineaceae bacterium]